MTQHIRRSQFVTTYGPGAILEGSAGPRVIPTPDIGLFIEGSRLRPSDYEISDQRMSQGLLGGARIFRLPSNAEVGISTGRALYSTKPFPSWKLCLNTGGHGGSSYTLYTGGSCPVCRSSWRRGIEAIRFIMACPEGHMDDIDWHYFVHRGSSCSQTEWFRWFGGGGAISNIFIECNRCGSRSESLGHAYGQNWKCTARNPENEPLNSRPPRLGLQCRRNARVVQRQASNLRIPEIRTLFSIPPRFTTLHNLLQSGPILENIIGSAPDSKEQLERILRNLVTRGRTGRATADEILRYSWEEIRRDIADVLRDIPKTYHELIQEELHALEEASRNGAPPQRGPSPESPVIFHVDPDLVVPVRGSSTNAFRVTPLLKLRTIVVQYGFRREVDTKVRASVVPVSFSDRLNADQKWYPGAEFLGEGLFINSDNPINIAGSVFEKWAHAARQSDRYPKEIFRDANSQEELNPLFVWWHTFAHLLIRSIAAEAGYSSASIRERIYLNNDASRGGLLLYATQPGSEGTLGGLIALAPHFQDMIDVALEHIPICSGDPLCSDHRFETGGYNGAACYACLLLSETSCEHRNLWLDRALLRDNPP
jgi:hypothetical protein